MTRNSDGTWKYHVLHRFAAFPNDGQYPDGGWSQGGGISLAVAGLVSGAAETSAPRRVAPS